MIKNYINYTRADYIYEDLQMILDEIKNLNPTFKQFKKSLRIIPYSLYQKINYIIKIKYPNSFSSTQEITKLLTNVYTLHDEFCITCGKRVSFCHGQTLRKHCSLKCGNSDINSIIKVKTSKKEHYGDENYNNYEKIKQTKLIKYGNEKYTNCLKIFETKKKNNTLISSYFEQEVSTYLNSIGLKNKKFMTRINNLNFEIDCYIPKLKIGIECNGNYYHSYNCYLSGIKLQMNKMYHHNKTMTSFDKGIELIHIWEDQWKSNKDSIKNFLYARLIRLTDAEINTLKIQKEIINDTLIINIFKNDVIKHCSIFKKENNLYNWNILINEIDTLYCIKMCYEIFIKTFGKKCIEYKAILDKNEISLFETLNFNVFDILGPNKFFSKIINTKGYRFYNFEQAKQFFKSDKNILTNYDSGTIILRNFF